MAGGKYKLVKKVGRGGMAEVYRATMEGAQGFQKTVAVKRLLPYLTDNEENLKMLTDEARILSGLAHPNIVQVLDFEKVGNEYLLVLEFVHGRSLASVLKRCEAMGRWLRPGLVAHVASETAAGLAHAHRQTDEAGRHLRIVHRDISPQNILISKDGLVKVTDFGIAKATLRTTTTRAGFVKGKTAYLSPEQVLGRPADARTDIFSLGVVMHLMLARKKLFPMDSEVRTLEAIQRWSGLEAPEPDARIPPRLWSVLSRMLEPNPDDRYPDAEELSQELKETAFALSAKSGSRELADFLGQLFGDELSQPSAIPIEDEPMEELTLELHSVSLLHGARDRVPAAEGGDPPPAKPTRHIPSPTHRVWWRRAGVWVTALAGLIVGAGTFLIVWGPGAQHGVQDEPPRTEDEAPRTPSGKDVDPRTEPVAPDLPDENAAKKTVVSDRSRRVRKRLGTLVLNSDPWAYVEIDGKKQKAPTPIMGLKLSAGKHKIRLYNPVVKRSKTFQVLIQPGKTTRKAVRF